MTKYCSQLKEVLINIHSTLHISSDLVACMVSGESERLLDWDTVQHKLPWNVVLLLGSGFAMAKAAEVVSLTNWSKDHF